LNWRFRVMSLLPYLMGGAVMWLCMLKSGVHATVAGVLLAFAIPFSAKGDDEASPSHLLENFLHKPVAFLILPAFALANTAIVIGEDWIQHLVSLNGIGIIAGLVIGKPLGLTLFCFGAVSSGMCRLPAELGWRHICGAGVLGGIGFTMSIFIANLAFSEDAEIINAAKMAILCASILAGVAGYLWLQLPRGDSR
jgi:NhaA family Na+:H+ antiporter